MSTPPALTVSHDEVVARLLAKRPGLAVEYLKVAAEDASDPVGRVAFLRALRHVAKAKGVGQIAAVAGLSVPSLTRSLADAGNPTLKTLGSVVAAAGGRITVTILTPVPDSPARERTPTRPEPVAKSTLPEPEATKKSARSDDVR